MNEHRIAQLRAEAERLTGDYRRCEAELQSISQRLIDVDAAIQSEYAIPTASFVVAAIEDRRRAAHAEDERVRAENAAVNEAWRQLQMTGETDESRREREAHRQRLIEIEEDRQQREDENRRRRMAEFRERGVVVYE